MKQYDAHASELTSGAIPRLFNSIFTINPYRWMGGWVFDDEAVGLVKEAFVAGADDLLDKISDGRDSVLALFSDIEFPSHQFKLQLLDTSPAGSNYYCEELDQHLWLCPALFLYYPKAPKTIYLQIK